MKRRIARENAFIAAFEASFNANSIEEIVAASREQDEYAVDAYGEALLANFYAHSAEVDDLIKARLKDWTLARLPRVNAAILRLAVTEMRFNGSDDMDSIVINEAVELAKKIRRRRGLPVHQRCAGGNLPGGAQRKSGRACRSGGLRFGGSLSIMYTLGIDTSNYATSLAVFDTAAEEVVCDRKRFLPVKPGELGLRQSDAVFHHTAALPELLRELDAEFPLHRVDAVGVSEKPRPVEGSYMPCFLTGLAVAQGLALARGVPLVRTTHQQGHIAASLLSAAGASLFARRVLVFHISGGTTELLLCSGTSVVCRVGGSTDLYAGQAVDRIGVKLGFAFPAGAEFPSSLLNAAKR